MIRIMSPTLGTFSRTSIKSFASINFFIAFFSWGLPRNAGRSIANARKLLVLLLTVRQ